MKPVDPNQIKYMVERFLGWRLPENFHPDAGISFVPDFNVHTLYPMKHEPTGTNLFDYTQAEAMVRYMLEGLPEAVATPQPMPTGDGPDVGREASRMLSGLGAVEIAADLESRIAMGEKKYGSRLKTNNGRNALMDAYQEALDGIHYACQYKMEGHSSEPLAGFIKVALALRRLLDQPRG